MKKILAAMVATMALSAPAVRPADAMIKGFVLAGGYACDSAGNYHEITYSCDVMLNCRRHDVVVGTCDNTCNYALQSC
mgnify:CR=1 FL=1